MNESLTPGWYTSDNGTKRYWDGEHWLIPETQVQAPQTEGIAKPGTGDEPIAASPARKKRWPWVVVAVVVVIAILGGVFATWAFHSSHSTSQIVLEACETELRDSLKNPSAAKFIDSQVMTGVEYYSDVINRAYAESMVKAVSGDGVTDSQVATAQAAVDDYIAGLKDDAAADLSEGIEGFVVTGQVDAQNGFGATTREEWACSVTVNKGEVGWPIILKFGDEYSLEDEIAGVGD